VRRIVVLVVLAASAGGVYVLIPPAARLLPQAPSGLTVPVRGAVHIHTRRSDGSGTIEDVSAAASRAGLRFVIVTDHGDATRAPDMPEYRNGVLVIDAVEISTFGGHVVAIGLPRAPYRLAGEPRDVLEDIARLGGFSVAAHPVHAKEESRWTDWDATFDGLEWLNGDSAWRDETAIGLARMLLVYAFRPVETLGLMLDRDEPVMRRWDTLTAHRRVVALAAADAHARVGLPSAPDPLESRALLRMPGYEAMFRTVSIALPQLTLSGDAARDSGAVIDEIRAGRVFSSVDAIAPQPAFAFSGVSGSNQALAGESLPIDGPVRLRVDLQAPPDARIALVRDGVEVLEATTPSLRHEGESKPGVYRVEVKVPGAPGEPPVPWIVSNPIYVGRPPSEPRPATPRAPATNRLDLYGNGPVGEWTVERSTAAQAALDVVDTVDGTGLLLRYALSGAASASPFAALAVPAGPMLSQYDRVVFTAHADQPMRLSVQLRIPPAEQPGERWRRAVYVDERPREIAVSFDEMMPVGTASPRQPTLQRVQSLLFVVDTLNTKPGTAGRVYLDDVRYER
jgi:hypothetical protein